MADPHTAQSNPDSATHAAPAKKETSPIRLILLLVVLVVVVGLFYHDRFIAQPQALKANDDLQQFVDEMNAKGVSEGKPLTPDVIQEHFGRKPNSSREGSRNEQPYMEEVYRYGLLPNRQYVLVLYDKRKESWHYSNHSLNAKPEDSLYPGSEEPQEPGTPPTDGSPPPPAMEPGPDSSEGKGADAQQPANDEKASDEKAASEASSDEAKQPEAAGDTPASETPSESASDEQK